MIFGINDILNKFDKINSFDHQNKPEPKRMVKYILKQSILYSNLFGPTIRRQHDPI